MKKSFSNVYALLKALRSFLQEKCYSEFFVYSNNNIYGRGLIKNKINDKKYMLNPWDSGESIGKSKLQKFVTGTREYRRRMVDTYIFLGKSFRENAKQMAIVEKNIVLIEVHLEKDLLNLYGSVNIESELVNALIEFASIIGFEITYEFEGRLKHKNGKEAKVEKVESKPVAPRVFISYSWDNENHRHWVLKLAAELLKNGIQVLIDEWDLDNYKNDLQFFMESGIREANFVIIVCTPNYCERANARIGGVGVENTIMTGEFFNAEKDLKYIPISRQYDLKLSECLPTYLKTKYVIDFKDDKKYDTRFDELIRKIFGIPKYKRPQLGNPPIFTTEEI